MSKVQWPAKELARSSPAFTLEHLAIVLWLGSLFVPTIGDSFEKSEPGYVLLVGGLLSVYAVLFAPLHIACWSCNFIFAFSIIRLLRKRPRNARSGIHVGGFLLNLVVGVALGLSKQDFPMSLPGLLVLPGYYLWMSALLCNAIEVVRSNSHGSTTVKSAV